MILIYNLSGLLLGLAGAAVGLFVALATGRLSMGLFCMALVWAVFGWRRVDPVTKAKRPFPSVFFIPLAFIGILLCVLAVPMYVLERFADARPRDPRAAMLDDDESTLRALRAGGDADLSPRVLKRLEAVIEPGETKVGDYRVFSRVGPGEVLVIVQVPNLRQYTNPAREQLLDLIADVLGEDERTRGKRAYIAIKGRVAYGAIRGPGGATRTGAAVSERVLYDFYGAETSPVTLPATTPAG